MTPSLDQLKISLFADTADIGEMRRALENPLVKGFTTNPSLVRAAGVSDYKAFALDVLSSITRHPVSFEVIADDLPTMAQQAEEIATWGENVYVKIPVMTTKGEFTGPILSSLSQAGIKLNVTAIMTAAQVAQVAAALAADVPSIVSVFAGRIADTGRDPIPCMVECLGHLRRLPTAELLWASPREVLNIFQADEIGCHIITVTTDHLKKLALIGKDLDVYTREAVTIFYADATKAGLVIPVSAGQSAKPAPLRQAAGSTR